MVELLSMWPPGLIRSLHPQNPFQNRQKFFLLKILLEILLKILLETDVGKPQEGATARLLSLGARLPPNERDNQVMMIRSHNDDHTMMKIHNAMYI